MIKKIKKVNPAIFAACGISGFSLANGAMPSPEALGRLFGYPSSEIIVEDTTSRERILIQTPSKREQRKATVLPKEKDLLLAYLIHSRKPDSFFPVHVYIANSGTFLSPEITLRLAKIDTIPKERRAGLGSQHVAELGKGGFYFSDDLKVESVTPSVGTPSLVAALIGVVQPNGHSFEVKIARRAALVNQGKELESIPGGETYYNTFGPTSTQKPGPRQELAIPELTKLVIAEWLAETGSPTMTPPTTPTVPPVRESEVDLPPTEGSQAEISATPERPRLWIWLVGLIIICVGLVSYKMNRRT